MKNKFVQAHMKVADIYSQLSSAKRLQVGAIVVKDNRVISIGYNGMPAGWDNQCEYKDYDISRTLDGNYFPGSAEIYPDMDDTGRYKLTTKPEVIHAEANAIAKLARTHESGLDADMFITHAPCMECAKLIYGAGIKKVFYRHQYRNTDGVDFLNKCNIGVEQVD